jgi:dihydroneopterin aldolase
MHTDKLSDDWVEVCGLAVPVRVGVLPHERAEPRPVVVDLELCVHDLRAAGVSDRLEDTVDYAALIQEVRVACAGRHYQLIEAVAERIAGVCLADPRVARVRIRVAKPGAVAAAAEVAVRITRSRT